MSMSTVRLFVFLLVFGCSISPVFSQGDVTSCEQTLNQASAEFDAGRFYGLPALLKGCLEGGFTNEQRFRAYYLLAQAYLILDDPIAAEDSYLKLLRINPEFKPNVKTDPIDLVYLSRKFTSRPRFTPHARIGANVSFPRSIFEVSTYSSAVPISQTLRTGFQIGGGVDFNINDNWSLCLEGNFSTKSFTTDVKNIAKDDNSTVIDKSNWVDIPFYVKYSYDSGRWRPFAYAGGALNLLLSSSVTAAYDDNTVSALSTSTKIAEGPDIDLSYQRRSLNRSFIIGGGVKYKIGKNFVYADARYMFGLNSLAIPEKNYYNPDGTLSTAITTNQYVSDFFRLDNLSISVGYIAPLYDPRKIKKINPKGFFRNLFKAKAKKK
ncbi:MAG: outer membrane beta-barrel protein [Cyclobacteriaceae bacterium]